MSDDKILGGKFFKWGYLPNLGSEYEPVFQSDLQNVAIHYERAGVW